MSITVPSLRGVLSVPPWARNPLWKSAAAVPSLDLRFAENKSLVDAVSNQNLITFTRASSGTYFDSAVVLQTASTDVPRFDHNPVTGESLGLLVEEQRTNSIRNNTMVGAVAGTPGTLPTNWSRFSSGTATASVISTGSENGIAYIDIRFTGANTDQTSFVIDGVSGHPSLNGQTWTASAYFRLVGGSFANAPMQFANYEADSGGAVSAVTSVPINTVTSAPLASQRISVTRTNSNASTALQQAVLVLVATGAYDFTLRIGLPQLEQGAFARSVIPTSGTAVTRAADVASITGSAFSSWYRQDEGTVFADAKEYPFVSSALRSFYGFENSSQVNTDWHRQWIWNGAPTQLLHSIYTSSSGPIAVDFGTPLVNEQKRAAFAYRVNDYARSYNGAAPTTDTSGNLPVGIDRLGIGSHSSSSHLNGHIRRLTYWPQRLSNSTLQAITQ